MKVKAIFLVFLVVSYEVQKGNPKKIKIKRVRSTRRKNVADKKIVGQAGGNLNVNKILPIIHTFKPAYRTNVPLPTQVMTRQIGFIPTTSSLITDKKSGGGNVILPKVFINTVKKKCKKIRIMAKLIELCYYQRMNECNILAG